jgi:hypothetical protein
MALNASDNQRVAGSSISSALQTKNLVAMSIASEKPGTFAPLSFCTVSPQA